MKNSKKPSQEPEEKNELYFKSLVENVSDMIFVLDDKFQIKYMNPAVTNTLGFENLLNKSFGVLLCNHTNLAVSFKEGISFTSEMKVKHQDQTTRIIDCVINQFVEGDKINYLLNARDITARKKVEQRLKTKVSELDTFIYRSSHDMKGPVCTLEGLLSIAMNEITDEKAIEYLKLINQNNKKLDDILTSLIEITHITRKNSEKQIIDLPVFFHDLITRFNGTMKLVEFKSEISEIKEFAADPHLLENVFHNLLDNSIRYKKPEAIESEVNLKVFQQNGQTIFKLKDNGVGIPEDQQEKVFDLFYKANVASSGSGLGLYIAKESVDKMNGILEMESKQVEGTAVTVVIPNN
ncbi:MAG: ATP-binding protein [Bacteroidia bacterium]